jgi:hypothetical protein
LRVLVRRQVRQAQLIILWSLVVAAVAAVAVAVLVQADFVAPLQIRVVAAH